ncbi:MAG TPA: hypothetical protein VGA09_14635 [Candidatus Binatia bacterium]
MALGGLSLLAAIWAGLVRMDWNLAIPNLKFPEIHGPLMIVGFLGTVIGLERAVALKKSWAYGAPLFAVLSALAQLFGLPPPWSPGFSVISSAVLLAIFCFLWWHQHESYLVIIGLGALLWLVGNLLWLSDYPSFIAAGWWAGFLVLTITGERLELSRLRRLSDTSRLLLFFAIAVFLFGLSRISIEEPGSRVAGAGLIAIALWLLRWDIAWRTIRIAELPRFMAVSLLSGYVWLLAAGVLWIIYAADFIAGPHYDAMLHSIFLGFVVVMIFAHAPIILPSVMDVSMPFQNSFYAHLILLHLSLLLRIAGDLAEWPPARMWGGLLNGVAILIFLANNVRSVRIGFKSEGGQ